MSEPTVRFHTVPLSNAEGVLGVSALAALQENQTNDGERHHQMYY